MEEDIKDNEDKRQQDRKENEANIKEMIDNIVKENEEKRAKERKEDKEKFDKILKEYEAKLWKRRIVLGAECEQEKEAKRAELLAGKAPASPEGASASTGTSASAGSSSSAGASSSASAATSVCAE